MEVVLWGVRGSVPSPSQHTNFYGANTPCIELRSADGDLFIFDAGSGLRFLGETLPEKGECHLFITHGHADHTQGLGFFQPFYKRDWTINLYLPEWLASLPESYFDGEFFPVRYSHLAATINVRLLRPGETIRLGTGQQPSVVKTFATNHPGGNLAYRVLIDDTTFVYTGDHEIINRPDVLAFTRSLLENTDLAIVDAYFNRDEYTRGWGHSCWEDWLNIASEADVGTLVLTHHAPGRTDQELDELQQSLSSMVKTGQCPAYIAREGMRYTPPTQLCMMPKQSTWLADFIETLAQYKEEGVILDRILAKSRQITQANAGTVFLCEGNELVFTTTHNDSLFPVDSAYKYAYVSMRIPISPESIAGYAAVTGQSLNIANVRDLPPGSPYSFNSSFDEKTGFCTQSILAIPFFGHNKKLLGVIQLINSLSLRDRTPQPFTSSMEQTVRILSREAANILESSALIRESIKRLITITTLHDPGETGQHAERVGAIASEIYQCWAEKQGEKPANIRYFRGQLRLAAMLHDIGKVGISDVILKKNGKLTLEEFITMRNHTTLGAALFSSTCREVDALAYDISLHHHQRWNGKGYAESGTDGILAGESIPLPARITAIADVFDALVSKRCYKEAWPFDDAVAYLKAESGEHFDPHLVQCFLHILDTIKQIYERFPEGNSSIEGA